jgi:hypothetical protein
MIYLNAEIRKEYEPQAITHVKRLISRQTGQEVKLNTFLITFNTPNFPTSIRIGRYDIRINPYVPNHVHCFKCQTWTGPIQRKCHLIQVFRGWPWWLHLWLCSQMCQLWRIPYGFFWRLPISLVKTNQSGNKSTLKHKHLSLWRTVLLLKSHTSAWPNPCSPWRKNKQTF